MSKLRSIALWKQILAGILIGLAIGFLSPRTAEIISPIGTVFLRLLRMLIVPLVFFSIVSGICKMGDTKQLRSVGGRFVLYILITSTVAAAIGVVLGLIFRPGVGTTEFLATDVVVEASSYSFIDNVINWVPTNIVESMVNAEMLQIIVFCLFFGVALLALGKRAAGLIGIIDQGSDAMLKITEYVMAFSPLGILSLMATMVTTVSGAMMQQVLYFIILDVVGAILILAVMNPLILKLFRIPVLRFMKIISPAMLVAVSTTSSAATLPVSIKLSDEQLGIPENIYGFTLPLGNTTGMNGFALFVGLCCVFASNLYGFPLSIGAIVQFVFLGLILSVGAAGVKGAGIVMSTVLLETLGMPLTLIPILAAIWPVIDPGHTLLNNVGDLVGTTVIAKQMDKQDQEVFHR